MLQKYNRIQNHKDQKNLEILTDKIVLFKKQKDNHRKNSYKSKLKLNQFINLKVKK